MGLYVTARQKFGRWTALEDANWQTRRLNDIKSYNKISCRCDCGVVREIHVSSLINMRSRSCGCLNSEKLSERRTHNLSAHPLYSTWNNMIHRCHNKNHRQYTDYGGRGIYVCDRWRDPITGVKAFIEDMGDKPDPSFSLERLNNDGPYSPENCAWKDEYDQVYNRRKQIRNRDITELKEQLRVLQAENDQLRRRIDQLITEECW